MKPWYFRRAPWLLVAWTLALLVPGTATLPLIDRDEPRFATATREMIERHDWIVPTFNGNYRFDKPALTYWVMRAGYAIFGIGEFGARVHAIVATLVLVLATWWTGRRWFGDAVGLLAAGMLASCLQVFIHGRLALADMPMIACVVVACVALYEALKSTAPKPTRTAAWWLLYGALGVGFLAKGPIVFAVPVLALLVFRFVLWRKPIAWSRLQIVPGLLVSLLIMGSWGIPALVATHGLFWQKGMGEHVIQRGYDTFNSRGYSPLFYLGTAPMSLFPWFALVGFLPWAVKRAWDERTAWLVCWAVAPYVIFTAYATQLPHYVLPAFPALALLTAQALVADRKTWPKSATRIAWGFVGVTGMIFLVALVAVRLASLPAEMEPLRAAFTGVFLVTLGLLLSVIAALKRWVLLVPGTVTLVVGGATLMGGALRQTSLTATSRAWVDGLPTETRCVGAGFSEPSLVFYTARRWTFVSDGAELADQVRQPGPLVVATLVNEADPLNFIRAGLLQRFGRDAQPRVRPGPKEFAGAVSSMIAAEGWSSREIVGFNLGRTRWQRVKVWVRNDGATVR